MSKTVRFQEDNQKADLLSKTILITQSELDSFKHDANKLSDYVRNNFIGKLKIARNIACADVKWLCDYFTKNNNRNRSFFLNMADSDFTPKEIKTLLDHVNDPVTGNVIHACVAINPPSQSGIRIDIPSYLESLLHNEETDLSYHLIDSFVERQETPSFQVRRDENGIARSCFVINLYKIVRNNVMLDESYHGTINAPIIINENGDITSCSDYTKFQTINGALWTDEEYMGTGNNTVQLNEEGDIISYDIQKIRRFIDDSSTFNEYIGTPQLPIIETDDGVITSCAERARYEKFANGQRRTTEEFYGAPDLPIIMDSQEGTIVSCSKFIKPHIIDGHENAKDIFIGTSASLITMHPNQRVKSCNKVERFDVVDGRDVFRESIYGSIESPLTLDEDGIITSCTSIIADKNIDGQPLRFEFIGTQEAPIIRDKNGVVSSCANLVKYEIAKNGDLILLETFTGSQDLPITIHHDVVTSCAKLRRPKTIGDASAFEEYEGTKNMPIEMGRVNDVKSCAEFTRYQARGHHMVPTEIFSGAGNMPVLMSGHTKVGSCVKFTKLEIVNSHPLVKERVYGTEEHPITMRRDGTVKSFIKLKTYHIENESSLLEREYVGSTTPLTADKDGFIQKCDKYKNASGTYLGNVSFARNAVEVLRNVFKPQNLAPTQYDALYQVKQGELRIYDDNKKNIMTFHASGQDDVLIYHPVDREVGHKAKHASIQPDISPDQSISILAKDVNGALIQNLKTAFRNKDFSAFTPNTSTTQPTLGATSIEDRLLDSRPSTGIRTKPLGTSAGKSGGR